MIQPPSTLIVWPLIQSPALRREEEDGADEVVGGTFLLSRHPRQDRGPHRIVLPQRLVAGVVGDEARCDRVHVDAPGSELGGQRRGEAHQRELADAVDAAGDERAARHLVDDATAAALEHRRHDRPGADERAHHVDLHHPIPPVEREGEDRSHRDLLHQRRVVDEDVDAAELVGGAPAPSPRPRRDR